MSFLDDLIDRFRREPSRTGSLIVTIYGDVAAPRGGSLRAATLNAVLRRFGLEGGVVRTALSRLATDGWLERMKIGRHSSYRLTATGRAAFEEATRRIYVAAPRAWDGTFRLVLLGDGDERGAFERAGFGLVAAGTMIGLGHASSSDAIVLDVRAEPATARRLAARAWPLESVAERYRRFMEAFAAADLALAQADATDGLDALAARTLLIHDYRRIILRDPLLPDALLPEDWPGYAARILCGRLYRRLAPPSESWLDAHGEGEDGPLPPPDAAFHARFADLPAS